jgi:DNA-binding MarR family transcriptional regulator
MARQFAEIASELIESVSQWLAWNSTERDALRNMPPTPPGSQASEVKLRRITEMHEKKMDAKVTLVRHCNGLIDALPAGHELLPDLLELQHFFDGGGPDNTYRVWRKLRVKLKVFEKNAREPVAAKRWNSMRAGGAGARTVLNKGEKKTLAHLKKHVGERRMLNDIAVAVEMSRATVSCHLKSLRGKKLVELEANTRQGATITELGMRWFEKPSDS